MSPQGQGQGASTLAGVRIRAWLAGQAPFMYWRVLAGGFVGLIILWNIVTRVSGAGLGDLYILGFVGVPLTAIALWWRERGSQLLPALSSRQMALTLGMGAVAGLIAGWLIYIAEPFSLLSLGGALGVALCDIILNGAAVALAVHQSASRRALDGLALGVASAIGFLSVETLIAAWHLFDTVSAVTGRFPGLQRAAVADMDGTLGIQFWLIVAGQVLWMAMLGAALCRQRAPSAPVGGGGVSIPRDAVVVAAGAVVLHTILTYGYENNWLAIYLDLGFFVAFTLRLIVVLVLLTDTLLVSFFVREALRQAHGQQAATDALPIERAVSEYARELWGRVSGAFGGPRPTAPVRAQPPAPSGDDRVDSGGDA